MYWVPLGPRGWREGWPLGVLVLNLSAGAYICSVMGNGGEVFQGAPPPPRLSFSFSSLGESLGITLCQQL